MAPLPVEIIAAVEKMTDLLDYEIFARVIKAGSLSAAAQEFLEHEHPLAKVVLSVH